MNTQKVKNIDRTVYRGDLYYADLSPVIGSEQGGVRPVLVIQNNTGNRHSPTVIVAAITSRTTKAQLPTHVPIKRSESGLKCDSTILLEQVRTIDRSRLKEYIGQLSSGLMDKTDKALYISLGLTCFSENKTNSGSAVSHTSYVVRTAAASSSYNYSCQ
jgi:mRNA interferase MazF